MKTASWNRAVFAAMLILSLWACVNVNIDRNYPARRYFVLNANDTGIASQNGSAGVLRLAHVRVSPRYDGKGFVYRLAAQNFETDFYNQFLVAPGSMLTDELSEALRRANLFQYIVNSSSAVEPAYLLEATLDELYGDFSNDTAGSAVLGMTFVMSRLAGNSPQALFQKHYRSTVPLQARSPEALVRGWNRALEEILAALIADLELSSRSHDPAEKARSPF
jgi:uncharacterized lipoprotein YmbA